MDDLVDGVVVVGTIENELLAEIEKRKGVVLLGLSGHGRGSRNGLKTLSKGHCVGVCWDVDACGSARVVESWGEGSAKNEGAKSEECDRQGCGVLRCDAQAHRNCDTKKPKFWIDFRCWDWGEGGLF